MEDLNPLGQTGEQPGVGPREETLRTDSVLESLRARQSMKESTTAADGVGGGERLATMVGESMETPGATAGATESSKVRAGATDVMSEYRAQRPAASEEQAVHPEMPQGKV